MSGTAVKPWNKVVSLRPEVRTGALSLQEFAADLFDVVNRTGKRPLYENPGQFFSLTYATKVLLEVASETARRLSGTSPKGVRQLELTYGGGKTHTMVTLTHLFRDPASLPDVSAVRQFEAAMGGRGPKTRIAAVCFDKLDLEKGIVAVAPDGAERALKQPWSVLAWQIAGADGLRLMHGEGRDEERDSPPRDGVLEPLFEIPVKEGLSLLILFDEVLMYVSERARMADGELFKTRFEIFLQSLTQAVAKVDRSCLIASLLASDPKKDDALGRRLLLDMSNMLGRKEDEGFMPVGKDDVAEILRRRLLDPATTRNPETFRPNVQAALRAIGALDPEFDRERASKEKSYLDSFPFDPVLMDALYTRWTNGLPLFQRTRGVLRTFALALRDAEDWDPSPVAGVSILLSKAGEMRLPPALSYLASVARIEGVEGETHNWTAILERELAHARDVQARVPSLATHREVEQAVVGTFVFSQPPSLRNTAKTTDLFKMAGAAKPQRIALVKGLADWAARSWFLDEEYLVGLPPEADGWPGMPKEWRLGGQPNLKQMHDDARANRVAKDDVDKMLLEEIQGARWLDRGASGLGAKVHRLPDDPKDVPSDGELRYVILGPAAQSESGKPSALAVRFCEEVTPGHPRTSKNAIVIAAPERTLLAVAAERARDHLAWLDVLRQLKAADGELDPRRSSKLQTEINGSKREIGAAVRQAYCIVVTRGTDDAVHAMKVTVDTSKDLFQTIKEEKKCRIEDVALLPDLLLSGGQYDVWRADEPSIRVKTLVNAFAERPKLPKMLRRQALLDTVANGCEQGLLVLSLTRPDRTRRTWWRTRIDEAALGDDALEAVQCAHATLESLDPFLVVPGRLEGLSWEPDGLKVADLLAYFDGYVVRIEHAEQGWTDEKPVPKVPEAKVLAAVSASVATGNAWLLSGVASVWRSEPPAGVANRLAVLRQPPDSIDVSSLTPEALPDAWTDERKTTAMALSVALAAKRGVAALPWPLIEDAIDGALDSRFMATVSGAVPWPCRAHEAGSVEFAVPEVKRGAAGFAADRGGGADDVLKAARAKSLDKAFWGAELDANGLGELLENIGDVLAAAGSLTVRFRVSLEFGEGEKPTPTVARELRKALEKVGKAMA